MEPSSCSVFDSTFTTDEVVVSTCLALTNINCQPVFFSPMSSCRFSPPAMPSQLLSSKLFQSESERPYGLWKTVEDYCKEIWKTVEADKPWFQKAVSNRTCTNSYILVPLDDVFVCGEQLGGSSSSRPASSLQLCRWFKRELCKRCGLKPDDLKMEAAWNETMWQRAHRRLVAERNRKQG